MIVNGEWYLVDKLERMLRVEYVPPQSWRLELFQNDYTPVGTSVPADFAAATFGGYVPRTIQYDQWQSPTIDGGAAVSLYGTAPLSWTVTSSPQTVYGYWVRDLVADRFLFGERLADPAVLTVGATLLVQPRYREADYLVCP